MADQSTLSSHFLDDLVLCPYTTVRTCSGRQVRFAMNANDKILKNENMINLLFKQSCYSGTTTSFPT